MKGGAGGLLLRGRHNIQSYVAVLPIISTLAHSEDDLPQRVLHKEAALYET